MSGAIIWLKPRGFLMSLALICWVLGGATAVGCGGGEEVPTDTALVTTPVLTPTPVTSVTPESTAIPVATAAPTSTPPGVRTPTPTFRPHRPTIQPPPTPSPTPTPIPPPSADFSVDVLDGAAPLTVNFSPTSTGEVSAVRWDFGDGSHSEETAPVHGIHQGRRIRHRTKGRKGPAGTTRWCAPSSLPCGRAFRSPS